MIEYFQIIEYLRKSITNNIMKIYENPLFDSNVFQTIVLAFTGFYSSLHDQNWANGGHLKFTIQIHSLR